MPDCDPVSIVKWYK